MKNLLLLISVLLLSMGITQAQSLEELKTQQAEKMAMADDLKGQADAALAEADALQKEIDILSGWRKGVAGMLGFDWNKSNGWIANPNPDAQSSSLNLDLTGYLMNDKEKTFWHNKANIVKAWSDVDLSAVDDTISGDGLFDNGTVDILNISSLAGYKLSEKFALSGQAELNTSVENFIKPGTLDFGVGATWLPMDNLTVMIHPFNYNIAFPADGSPASTSGSIGAKIRADYIDDFMIAGKKVDWSSTLTAYLPYTAVDEFTLPDGSVKDKSTYYTWLNSFSFEVWNGIGVGIGWGLRNADFESTSTQSYTNIGLSYKLK